MALETEDNRRGYASAGILPICRIDGLPHALLGREEYNRTKRWSDFAGRKKGTDVDVYATAAREFCEESVHTVQLNGVKSNSVQAVAEHLRQGNYVLRITIEKVSKGKRVVFVVLADYDRGVVQRFSAVRAAQMHLDRYIPKLHVGNYQQWWLPGTIIQPNTGRVFVLPDYFEKALLQYWPFQLLNQAVANHGTIPFTARSPSASFRLDIIPLFNAVLPILTDGSLSRNTVFTGAVAVCPWSPTS